MLSVQEISIKTLTHVPLCVQFLERQKLLVKALAGSRSLQNGVLFTSKVWKTSDKGSIEVFIVAVESADLCNYALQSKEL